MAGGRWRMKTGGWSDQENNQAERFALAILMPDQAFYDSYVELRGDIRELSKRFGVTMSNVQRKIEVLFEEKD